MTELNICSWNLRCFGLEKCDLDRVGKIALSISLFNPDICVLSEVFNVNLLNNILSVLSSKYNLKYTKAPICKSDFSRPFQGKKNEYHHELLVCLYKSEKLNLVSSTKLTKFEFKTTPAIWSFSTLLGGYDVNVCGFHLQYVRGNRKKEEWKKFQNIMRKKYGASVKSAIGNILISDIIFCGDSNTPGPKIKRSAFKIGRFHSSSYITKSKSFITTNLGKKKCCYDHIFYSKEGSWKTNGNLTLKSSILKLNKSKYISDHKPICTKFVRISRKDGRKPKVEIHKIIKESSNGNSEAQYLNGLFHKYIGDKNKANIYFRLAAEKGHDMAKIEIIENEESDPVKKFDIYQKLANNGNKYATVKIASFYHSGIGCVKNKKKSLDIIDTLL